MQDAPILLAGYRFLEHGDIVQEEDLMWHEYNSEWHPAASTKGMEVAKFDRHWFARERMEKE